VAIQANGKIVAAGGSGDFYIVRFNADGSLDDSLWGTGGILITDFGGGETSYAVEIQPDGKIVAAGVYQNTTGGARFAVARFLGDPLSPTAANVSVSGRIRNANGTGAGKIRVSLTDLNGNSRTAITNPFGYYKFDEIPAGETYVVSVIHKKYVFTPNTRILNVSEDVSEVNFTADE
jgi:uncharacterized delta-60 repeat protein